MKRIPLYLVVAICGLMFMSAGVMTILGRDRIDVSAKKPKPTAQQTTVPPTATAVPPTATTVPPTVTPVPPTATTVPPTPVPPTQVQPTSEPASTAADSAVIAEQTAVVGEVTEAVVPTSDSSVPAATAVVTQVVVPAVVTEAVVPTSDSSVPAATAVVTQVVVPANTDASANNAQSAPPAVPAGNEQAQQPQAVQSNQPAPALSALAGGDQPQTLPTPEVPAPVQPQSDTVTNANASGIQPTANPDVAPAAVQSGNTANTSAEITGVIGYALKKDSGGITLLLTLPDGTAAGAMTSADGKFTFANLQPGTYRLDARAPGFLPAQIQFTLQAGQKLVLPPALLRGGDSDRDGKITIVDVTLIAANFNRPASLVPQADLNGDGVIDVRDMALIGSQYGLSGPIGWK